MYICTSLELHLLICASQLYGFETQFRLDENTLDGLKERIALRDPVAVNTSYTLNYDSLKEQGTS